MHQIDTPPTLTQIHDLLNRSDADLAEPSTIELLHSAFIQLESTVFALQQELRQERHARKQAEAELKRATQTPDQTELKHSRALMQATLESTADGILAIDCEGNILSINQKFRQQWKAPDHPIQNDRILAKSTSQLLVDSDAFYQQIETEYKNLEVESHTVMQFKDGRIVERFSKPLRLNNTIIGRVISTRDITEQHQAQIALTESERLLRTVVTNTPTILYAIDQKGIYTLAEGKGLEAIGLKPNDLVGKSIYEFYQEFPNIIRDINLVLQGEDHRSFLEFGGVTYDNRATPLYDAQHQVIGMIGVATDVTAQHQAERALYRAKQDLEVQVEARTAELQASNANLQREVNQRKLIEQSLREKQNCLQLLNHLSQGVTAGLSVNQLINLAIEQTAQLFPDVRVLYGIIESRRIKVLNSAQPDEMPELKGFLEGLYLTSQYSALLNGQNPVLVEDVLQEPALAPMATEMLKRKTRAIAMVRVQHTADQTAILALNAAYPKQWTFCETQTLAEVADYLSIVLQKIRAQEDRQTAEERLKLFKSVVVNGNDAVIITNADIEEPKISYVNEAFIEATGYTPEEVIGKTPRILQGERTDREQLTRIREAMSEGRAIQVELMNYRKDGSEYWVDLNVVPISDARGNLTHFVALQRDITDRKWSEKALLATQARLKYLLSSSPSVIYTCQPKRNRACTFVSENITQQLGYEIWQYLKDPHFWIDHIHPEDLPSVLEHLDRLAEVGEVTCEYRFLHQDGSYRWLRDDMKLLSDQSVEVIGSVVDISDRKWAEEQIRESLQEKEVMLKEIHHRVKNNLQVVSSLLKLQAGYIQDKRIVEVFKESQNRVGAMALIHEKLYQSEDLAKTNFSEYIQSLVTALFRSYSANSRAIRLRLDIQDVKLTIDTAIPCGLIINELVSNSMKYAFPTGEPGEIYISLQAQETESHESPHYQLTVGDSGRGFPSDLDFRNTQSLGLQLVCSLIRQLRGQIDLTGKSGVQFTMCFTEQKIRV
ncbi:MAG: PAS domain S-box protein [Leptolyngbya sp. Prado105]|nr:PAS domain S-box protein [Leptolyngbya sp. Prado105]